mmetsp:Transcript_26952/g.92008  ORF Transcript_26952/g.92008 Transcript_26952/m.92008 type:complete len:206 (-) Transcript_26952:1342-1959(-)
MFASQVLGRWRGPAITSSGQKNPSAKLAPHSMLQMRIWPILLNMSRVQDAMGNEAMIVEPAPAVIVPPSSRIASLTRASRVTAGEVMKHIATCRQKSTLRPTSTVSESASAAPISQPREANMPSIIRVINARLNSVRDAMCMQAQKIATTNTALTIALQMESTVPCIATICVRIPTHLRLYVHGVPACGDLAISTSASHSASHSL